MEDHFRRRGDGGPFSEEGRDGGPYSEKGRVGGPFSEEGGWRTIFVGG